jgi:hypothetical protein
MSASDVLNERPKRVVLRLRVNEFDGRGPEEFTYPAQAAQHPSVVGPPPMN